MVLKRWLAAALAGSVIMSGFAAVDVSAASRTEDDAACGPHGGLAFAEFETIELPGVEIGHSGDSFHFYTDQPVRPLSLFNGSTENFYDLLTNTEKNAYDMMKAALQNDITTSTVDLPGITDLNAAKRAYCAFVADYPEYFWLLGVSFSHYTNSDGSVYDLDITFKYCAGQTADNIESNYSAVMNTVNRVVSEAAQYSSDYDKIKYFAEYISDNMVYNTNAANKGGPGDSAYANCWNAYGALISGSGVCEAYAEAFKLLCDRAGIPCISVYSLDHEWNAVKLDGKWYYVDVTWIDTGVKSTYRYSQWLAVGTSTAKKNDNSAGSHTQNSNAILADFDAKFTYPSISTADYSASVSPDSGSGTETGTGTGSSGGGSSGTSAPSASSSIKNKDVSSAGTMSYKAIAGIATPAISVSVPSSISAVINPYGTAVRTKNGEYGADGVTSPAYTIRNNTKTNAIAIYAKAYLTVPTDKSGVPVITVCESPEQAKELDEKALSAYLLASVSKTGVTDAASESGDLVAENSVKYSAGKTIVFADATLDSNNSNSGTLMVIPRPDYEDGVFEGYYYGQFKISGVISENSRGDWNSSDKVSLVVVFNIVPCPDPE